jgi:hypothetical protein
MYRYIAKANSITYSHREGGPKVMKQRQQAICDACGWAGPTRTISRLGDRLAAYDLRTHACGDEK